MRHATWLATPLLTLTIILASAPVATAQATATVGFYPASATDVTAPPTVYVTKPTPCMVTPKRPQRLPDATTTAVSVAVDDPTDASFDCVAEVTTEYRMLPPGGLYKVAVTLDGRNYGLFSPAFSPSAAQPAHACDASPTSGTVLAGARTYSGCYPDAALGGSPVTGIALYDNQVRSVVPISAITVGGTANAAGWRQYSMPYTAVVGTHDLRFAPINALGEADSLSPPFTLTVTAPATKPTGVGKSIGVQ